MASNRCFVTVLVFAFGYLNAMRREMGCGGGSKGELPTVGIAVFGIENDREKDQWTRGKDVILIFVGTGKMRGVVDVSRDENNLSPRVSYEGSNGDWNEAEERSEEQSEMKRMKQSRQKEHVVIEREREEYIRSYIGSVLQIGCEEAEFTVNSGVSRLIPGRYVTVKTQLN